MFRSVIETMQRHNGLIVLVLTLRCETNYSLDSSFNFYLMSVDSLALSTSICYMLASVCSFKEITCFMMAHKQLCWWSVCMHCAAFYTERRKVLGGCTVSSSILYTGHTE